MITASRERPMIRVLIADDEPMVRTGIRSILATDPDIEVVGDAADGGEAVEQAHRHRPDVALLDIRMPNGDGLTAAQQIRTTLPDTAVIILTTFGEDEYIARALDHGAAGFLLKALDPRDLIAGVHAVANGAACLSPIVALTLPEEPGQPPYVSAILTRLEVRNRVQAAIIAVEAGLVNDAPPDR